MPLTAEQKQLVTDNYRLIYKFAGVHKLDITDDNIYDALTEGLVTTALRYNSTKATFSTLAFINMRNSLWKYYRDSNAQKRQNLNEILSLDYSYSDSSDDDATLYDAIPNTDLTPEEEYCFKSILYGLTKREKDIAVYLYKGFTNRQIGELIGVSASRVNEIIKTIRKKISVYAF